MQIRYLKKDDKEDIHTLSIDTNQNEQERWYGNGSEKWTHLAINWDSESGQIKLYIDGELKGKQENQNWKPFNVGENSWMKVGDSAKGVHYIDNDKAVNNNEFNGYIDGLKIFKEPLSSNQIRLIFQKEKNLIKNN